MNYEELAFVNHQLAGMLKAGIPLEGALVKLCADMRRGPLRDELQALGSDLAGGRPLADAIAARNLPEVYQRLLRAAARSEDFPTLLTAMADYFQRGHLLWVRLKGLMVYPCIVMLSAIGLCIFVTALVNQMLGDAALFEMAHSLKSSTIAMLWAPVVVLALVGFLCLLPLVIPAARRWLRWNFSGFREASLAQLSGLLAVLLRTGMDLASALSIARELEDRTPAAGEIDRWRARIAEGRGKISELGAEGRTFPPLFYWLIASAGEDLAKGLERASQVYHSRANYRLDLMLYAALPLAIFFLGLLIAAETVPLARLMISFITAVGDVSGP